MSLGYDSDGKRVRRIFYGWTRSEVAMKMTAALGEKLNGGHASVINDDLRTYTGTKTIFQRLMSQNGLAPYKLHFHSLRHTYSSMLFESRENPKVIQMLLGHKDVTTTIRTYNSVDRSYFKQAVDKLDSKFHFD